MKYQTIFQQKTMRRLVVFPQEKKRLLLEDQENARSIFVGEEKKKNLSFPMDDHRSVCKRQKSRLYFI